MVIFLKKITKDELGEKRNIDICVEETVNSIKSRYRLVPDVEIKAWKAYLIIFFISGILAALIWNVYVAYLWEFFD